MFRRFTSFSVFCAVCIALLALCSCGSSVPLFESMSPGMDSFSSVEIPFRFDQGYPILTLHTGADSIELALDTGAAQVSIGLLPETIRALRLQVFGKNQTLRTNYDQTRYRRSILPEARLGGLIFHNLVCDQAVIGNPGPAGKRGILGLALLREFHVLVDYKASTLVLYKPGSLSESFLSGTWRRLPFRDDPDGIHVVGTLEGVSKPLRWS